MDARTLPLNVDCACCGTAFQAKASQQRKYCSHYCYLKAKGSRRADEFRAGVRTCALCRVTKTLTEYSPCGRADAQFLHAYCKPCRCLEAKQRRLTPALVSRRQNKYETDLTFRSAQILRITRKRCRRSGTEFDLDQEWIESRFRGRCELTGLPFDMSIRTGRPNIFTPSIDRIVAGGGYTKANCRVIVWGLNAALQNWGLEAFMPIARALVLAELEAHRKVA